MAKKNFKKSKKNNRIRYKNMSGKHADTPGQIVLEIDGKNNPELVEQQPTTCSPYYCRQYYEAFRDFLNASGTFGRTYHLLKSIVDSPALEQLEEELAHTNLSDFDRKKKEGVRDALVNHLKVMHEKQHCETVDDLRDKADSDWQAYKKALNWLIISANKANVPMKNMDKDHKEQMMKGIMYAFFHLANTVRGNCRREYYREKYINKAIRGIEKDGYYPVYSIHEMEAAFQNDKEWQERYLHRKKKT